MYINSLCYAVTFIPGERYGTFVNALLYYFLLPALPQTYESFELTVKLLMSQPEEAGRVVDSIT